MLLIISVIWLFIGLAYIVITRLFGSHKDSQLTALQISNIDNMSGIEFEHYVAALFRRRGYTARVTKASGDLGIDIIIEKAGIKYGVQVKRQSSPISRRAVSDAVGALNHYKCQNAIVVTNNYFTRDAIELARSNNCQLVDRDLLAAWIRDFQ
jgi:restriction system protein